jgi:hypothetical protein
MTTLKTKPGSGSTIRMDDCKSIEWRVASPMRCFKQTPRLFIFRKTGKAFNEHGKKCRVGRMRDSTYRLEMNKVIFTQQRQWFDHYPPVLHSILLDSRAIGFYHVQHS